MKFIKFYLLIFLLSSQYLYSQELPESDSSNFNYWINAGIRLNMIDDAGVNIGYNFGFDKVFFQTMFSVQKFPNASRTMQTSTGTIAVGSKISDRIYLIAGFIGPSINFGEKILSRANTQFTTIGLNINVQMFFRPIEETGIGVEFIHNINNISSFSFLHFSISINQFN